MTDSDNPHFRFSLAQLDAYGPWTVTPAPRRETDLQALQARFYADFADFVGRKDGYAFFNRFDNLIGTANRIPDGEFRRFQERVANRYPVTVSIGVGAGATPREALGEASDRLTAAGSAQSADRQEVLASPEQPVNGGQMTVAHLDIIDVTTSYTDQQHPMKTHLAVYDSVSEIQRRLWKRHDSVAHFVGGDNVIAVCPELSTHTFEQLIEEIEQDTGIQYQVGIGRGTSAHEAGTKAKYALEHSRETGQRVVMRRSQPSTVTEPPEADVGMD